MALSEAHDWFGSHTYGRSSAGVDDVAALLDGRRVSVVLPARDESGTIGAILDGIATLGPVVGEVLVVDSRSSDDTATIARDRGAVVHRVEDEPDPGKGAAMRLGVERMSGELGVFVDADIVDFDPGFVLGLVHTLVRDPRHVFVKGFYDRPWNGPDGETRPVGGGRVTELVARPLIARRAPRLAGFAQPLAGEVAFVRDALLDVPWVSGYGVDIALMLDVVERFGLERMAQVDLGERLHGHQDLDALGRMAMQVAAAFEIVQGGADRVDRIRTTVGRGADRLGLSEETVSTWRLGPIR